MWSLTLPSMGPTSGAEKFCSSARKDFFDSIGHNGNEATELPRCPVKTPKSGLPLSTAALASRTLFLVRDQLLIDRISKDVKPIEMRIAPAYGSWSGADGSSVVALTILAVLADGGGLHRAKWNSYEGCLVLTERQ